MSSGAGTSESAASAGCSLSERDRFRPRNNINNNNNGGNVNNNHHHRNNTINSNNNNSINPNAYKSEGGLTVFTWGRGEDGQLGLGDTSDQDEPTYVDALRGVGVRQIACGSGHTVVLSTEGEVYTWGRGGTSGFQFLFVAWHFPVFVERANNI